MDDPYLVPREDTGNKGLHGVAELTTDRRFDFTLLREGRA